MNEILLLVLTWLPLLAESGLLVFVIRYIAKQLSKHFSIPHKIVEENKALKSELAASNKKLSNLEEKVSILIEETHNNTLQMKGIKVNESIKKN